MTQLEFIEKIGPFHQKYAKQYGFKIASIGIAQACLESQYGTSYKASFNNFHGLKYRKNRVTCNSGYFSDGGSEQKSDGSYVPTTTDWYSFESMDKGVEGYYQFINIPNYAKVKAAEDPLTYLQAIKAAGYATSLNYVQNVYKVVQKWNLTKYDQFNQQEQKESILADPIINIIQRANSHNTTTKENRKIDWIVIHYTAGTTSYKGAAQSIAQYFATTSNQSSADFIVDDVDIVQYNPDPRNLYCWAVGGKQYPQKSNSLSAKYYGVCQNNNSISIEICSRKKNPSTLNATDDDWYFTDTAIANAVKLTKYLMKVYNIKADHVITHNMVTGKWCPQPWTKNEAALSGWYNFQKMIGAAGQSSATQIVDPAPACPYLVKVTANTLNIRSGPGTTYSILGTVKKDEVFTIIEQVDNFGRLKSGAGWICLNYTIKK